MNRKPRSARAIIETLIMSVRLLIILKLPNDLTTKKPLEFKAGFATPEASERREVKCSVEI